MLLDESRGSGHCYRGDHLEVTARTLPGPDDVRRMFEFVKTDPVHQAEATRAWSRSAGTHTWVGEWHTHPSGEVHPSQTDLSTWCKLTQGTGMPMVFALAAPKSWGLFLVQPSWFRPSTVRLILVEHGMTGSLFGVPKSSKAGRNEPVRVSRPGVLPRRERKEATG